ncbi:hypothetical protein O6H91_10G102600 [Diphasiastrum complanatum]|uniref:Uncharacterized protein n=1 Tax=Diphasiastrum complanatum TaxID=34168 RepID=A0ACC2CKT6_DIPCM|nr:hypothetical protein O6H91_10G102600 [Diphasiastrum complanatum]
MSVPCCVECGTSQNPCRCKFVGPTLALVAFAIVAIIEWPLGALIYPFSRMRGRRMMANPVEVVYPCVKRAIPF